MSSGRHCTSTCSDTSAGTSPCSMHQRAKSKSVCEADGKPISISLKPMSSNSLNMRALRSWPIGSISAWLPSRRSTEHQIGAFSMRLDGQVRSSRPTSGIGLILAAGVGHAAGGADFASFVHRRVLRRTGGAKALGTAAPLSGVHAGIVTGKEHRRQIDRRALLQRARRSPIRPRSSSVEDSARKVSPAKAVDDFGLRGCVCMPVSHTGGDRARQPWLPDVRGRKG